MKKYIFCLMFMFSLFCFSSGDVYASDAESALPVEETEEEVVEEEVVPDYVFTNSWTELKNYVVENGLSPECAAIVNSLWLVSLKFTNLSIDLSYITALLLLLVLFEVWRVVRSWSKGVSLK